MDEKTTKIPSLKDFKESRRERDAQAQRSTSMQTKKQMERSLDRSKAQQRSTRSQKENEYRNEPLKKKMPHKAERTHTEAMRSRPASSDIDRDSAHTQRDRELKPRTYVRDSRETQRDARRAPNPDAQRQRRDRVPKQGASRGREDRQPANREPADRRQISKSTNRKPQKPQKVKNHKKPKKPLTPQMRKFRNVMLYIAMMAVVLLVGAILSLTVFFKTEHINVSGNEMYSSQEIIEASGLYIGENIFTAPKNTAKKRIEKALPYIESATVKSSIPDSITIDIVMAKPACVIESLGGYYVLNEKGKVLEVAATSDEIDAPVIEGLTVKGQPAGEYIEFESDVTLKALEEMLVAFSTYGDGKVTAINFSSSQDNSVLNVKYVYDNRIVVYLGIPEDITYKIQTAVTIIKEKIDVNNATLAGDLDVSMCHETNKSYFNQYTLIAPQQAAPTTAPTDTTSAEE
ncbi:MAG: FtsQ-type POTRA domain-containing protein [Ruminococcus sp.]